MKKRTRLACLILAAIFILIMLLTVILSSVSLAAESPSRSETVYVTLGRDGTPESILSSVYLTNPEKSDTLTDKSILTDLRNITGSEQPEISGETSVWKAEGEDVAFQGKADADLPFSIGIKYYLDGTEIAGDDLAGKSGHVRIEFTIENHEEHTVTVEDEEVTMYTPFTVIGFVTLPEKFTSLTAENAKISSDAGTTMLMAVIFPGLAKSLDLEAEDQLAESFAFEADVTNFSLSEMTFIAMNGLVDASDISVADDIKDVLDGFETLESGMNTLESGAKKLKKGAEQYKEGIESYTKAVSELSEAIKTLKDGITSAAQGVSGVSIDSSAISELQSAAAKLTELQGTLEQYYSSGTLSRDTIRGIIASYGASMTPPLTDEQIDSLTDSVMSAIGDLPEQPDLSELSEMVSKVNELSSMANSLNSGLAQLSSGLAQLKEGAEQLSEGAAAITENNDTVISGADSLTSGIDAIRRGIRKVNREGISSMVENVAKANVSLSRKDALMDLSDAYCTYSGLDVAEGESSVKFILTTEEIYEPLPLATPTPEPDSSETDLTREDDGTLPPWSYLVIGGAMVLLVMAVAIILVTRSKRKKAESDSSQAK